MMQTKVTCTKGVKLIKPIIRCDFFLRSKKIIGELLPCKVSKWFCVRCFMLESFISVIIARTCPKPVANREHQIPTTVISI